MLQEVFAAAYNAMLADNREINVRPWLYRIARNRSLNHLRRAQAIGVDSMDIHFAEGGQSTGDKVHKREEFRLLIGDVQTLPETQRTALLLREIDDLSYEQISEAMETTVPTVKSLLVRARVSLAEAAEARRMSCDEVGSSWATSPRASPKLTPPVRRHVKECERCEEFRGHLRDQQARSPPSSRSARSSCSRSFCSCTSAPPPPRRTRRLPRAAPRRRRGRGRRIRRGDRRQAPSPARPPPASPPPPSSRPAPSRSSTVKHAPPAQRAHAHRGRVAPARPRSRTHRREGAGPARHDEGRDRGRGDQGGRRRDHQGGPGRHDRPGHRSGHAAGLRRDRPAGYRRRGQPPGRHAAPGSGRAPASDPARRRPTAPRRRRIPRLRRPTPRRSRRRTIPPPLRRPSPDTETPPSDDGSGAPPPPRRRPARTA